MSKKKVKKKSVCFTKESAAQRGSECVFTALVRCFSLRRSVVKLLVRLSPVGVTREMSIKLKPAVLFSKDWLF